MNSEVIIVCKREYVSARNIENITHKYQSKPQTTVTVITPYLLDYSVLAKRVKRFVEEAEKFDTFNFSDADVLLLRKEYELLTEEFHEFIISREFHYNSKVPQVVERYISLIHKLELEAATAMGKVNSQLCQQQNRRVA